MSIQIHRLTLGLLVLTGLRPALVHGEHGAAFRPTYRMEVKAPLNFAVMRTYSERRHASLFDPETDSALGETEIDRYFDGFVPEVDPTLTPRRRARPEGKDLFVESSTYMYLAFHHGSNNGNSNISKNLWLDDIVMTERDEATDADSLINPDSLNVKPLPLRLQRGASIRVEVDATKYVRPTAFKAGGVSMGGLHRWNNTPFSSSGERTPASSAAASPGRQSPRSSALVPFRMVAMPWRAATRRQTEYSSRLQKKQRLLGLAT